MEFAPETVRSVLKKIPADNLEIIEFSEDMIELAEFYISSGVLSKKSKEDALHISAASISEVDVIVSWNFKHIVHIDKIRKYNAVNLLKGYKYIDIRTPMEVTENE